MRWREVDSKQQVTEAALQEEWRRAQHARQQLAASTFDKHARQQAN